MFIHFFAPGTSSFRTYSPSIALAPSSYPLLSTYPLPTRGTIPRERRPSDQVPADVSLLRCAEALSP